MNGEVGSFYFRFFTFVFYFIFFLISFLLFLLGTELPFLEGKFAPFFCFLLRDVINVPFFLFFLGMEQPNEWVLMSELGKFVPHFLYAVFYHYFWLVNTLKT